MIRQNPRAKNMKSDRQMHTLANDAFEEFGSLEGTFCLGDPPEPPHRLNQKKVEQQLKLHASRTSAR